MEEEQVEGVCLACCWRPVQNWDSMNVSPFSMGWYWRLCTTKP